MKLNRKFGLLLVALASVGGGLAVAATADTSATTPSTSAPEPHGGHWRHHEAGMLLVGTLLRATKQLNLTAEQQQNIKTILSNARAQHSADAQGSSFDLTVLANPGDPNYATAVQNAKTLASDRIQRASDLQNQIYNVLTAEQKAQLPQVLADMKAKFEQRRAAWHQRHAPEAANSGNG